MTAPATAGGGVEERVSAVVVNYNSRRHALACVSSLRSEGVAEVVVADNGIGLPEAPDDPSAEGRLGLHLVPRLAQQARAALQLHSDGGTRATLRFAVA